MLQKHIPQADFIVDTVNTITVYTGQSSLLHPFTSYFKAGTMLGTGVSLITWMNVRQEFGPGPASKAQSLT